MSIVILKNKSKILHGPKLHDSPLGFRLNSGARTTRYVGKESLVSRSNNITKGDCVPADLTQPSVVNNREMINRKYKCSEKGITNKHWVKSVDEPENKSQGLYINNLSNIVTCATDNNNPKLYENHIICQPNQTNTRFWRPCKAPKPPKTRFGDWFVRSSLHLKQVLGPCRAPIGLTWAREGPDTRLLGASFC